MTIMLAWSAEDAGKIIETYKSYEYKPPDDIMERSDTAPHQKVILYHIYIIFVTQHLFNYSTFYLPVKIYLYISNHIAVDQCFNHSKIR